MFILLNEKRHFPYSQSYSAKEVEEVNTRLREIDEESLGEVVLHIKERFLDEEKRRDQIESKARVLQGFTALAGSLIIGFAQFLIGTTSLLSSIRILITVSYVLIAASLLISVILAQKAINTTSYRRPKVNDWLNLREWNKLVITRQYAVDLYSSMLFNMDKINDKGTFLNGAQDWLRNTTYLLALLIIFLVGAVVSVPFSTTSNSEPFNVILITQTPTSTIMPTSTFTPIPTPTITRTPTQTATRSITNTQPPNP